MPYPSVARLASQIAKDILETAPALVRLPLSKVPFAAKAALLRPGLNLLLSREVKDGELDFLDGRWVGIDVKDLGLAFEVSIEPDANTGKPRLCVREASTAFNGEGRAAEVRFGADSRELLLIAAGKEDPDTLFFQRRLTIEGDTELGLMVKNLLLAIDLDKLPKPVTASLEKLASALEALERRAEPAWA